MRECYTRGRCAKGFNCKFLHDLSAERKSQKIRYIDPSIIPSLAHMADLDSVVDCLDSAARVLELRQSMDSALRDGWFSLSQAKYCQRGLLEAQGLTHAVNCALGSKPGDDDGRPGSGDDVDGRRTTVEGQTVVAVTGGINGDCLTFADVDEKKGTARWLSALSLLLTRTAEGCMNEHHK